MIPDWLAENYSAIIAEMGLKAFRTQPAAQDPAIAAWLDSLETGEAVMDVETAVVPSARRNRK